jgi:hypothetical protein
VDDLHELWLKFNEHSNNLAAALGRTSNIVGEYAEHLAHGYYGGRLLEISGSSADIEADDGTRYQVKSRKTKGTLSTQLNVIRSWDFEFLVVVLFGGEGQVVKAIEVPVEVAKEYGARNSHQNGWVITTSQKFLSDGRTIDITARLAESVKAMAECLDEPNRAEQNSDWINRSLQSVGQGCFVKYFRLFDEEAADRAGIVDTLRTETNYTENSCSSRASHGLRICREGRAEEALSIIANSRSRSVPAHVRQQAQSLLAEMGL